jgi:hypothetical protein
VSDYLDGVVEHVYVCAVCRRTVPWSNGADDDMPDACDDCWAAAHAALDAAEVES